MAEKMLSGRNIFIAVSSFQCFASMSYDIRFFRQNSPFLEGLLKILQHTVNMKHFSFFCDNGSLASIKQSPEKQALEWR